MAQVLATTPVQEKHPRALYLLFFTELWERFRYYGMRGLLTLYLSKAVLAGGLGFSPSSATKIYGWFTGFVYFTPIIGGWIADRYIGQRRAILIGGLTMAAGQFSLFSTPWLGTPMTYIGLLLIILGNGFFKPNISTLVGKLYGVGDPRRDSAFTIFYMGINTGAFLAPLVCGFLAEDYFAVKGVVNGQETVLRYAFEYGFLAAGIGMVIGQIVFNLLAPKMLGPIGLKPEESKRDASGKKVKDKLTKEEIDRVSVIIIITTFVVFFWAGFEQAGSSLTLYTDQYIDREVFGWLIPTSWFQSVNPLFIVLLGGFTANLWLTLAKQGKDLSLPVKMGMGMILLGIGFFFMVGAVMERGGDIADTTIKASIFWLLATYFFHTIGELCLSPIGLSMVTRLAPISLTSMLMGVWFLAPFIAQIAGGYIAAYVEELGAFTIFLSIGLFVIFAGLVLLLLTRKLLHMTHGAK
jgi:POT family proton-dependent oligopeptide transporter